MRASLRGPQAAVKRYDEVQRLRGFALRCMHWKPHGAFEAVRPKAAVETVAVPLKLKRRHLAGHGLTGETG